MTALKKHTDTGNDDKNKRDALIMLDNLEELEYSKTSMVDELVFNFGYTPKQAEGVYQDWTRKE